MSYYWFNRQELLDLCDKEKASEHYIGNKDVKKEKANNKCSNVSEEEKEAKRKYSRNIRKIIKTSQTLYNIKMSYYQFNRSKILKRAHYNYYNRGGKKAANYYSKNREVAIEKVTNRYRNLSEKEAKREYQGGRYSHKY